MLGFFVKRQFEPKMGALQQNGPLVIFSDKIAPGIPHENPTIFKIETFRDQKATVKHSHELPEGARNNCVLFRIPVHNLDINNSILIECLVFGSKITGSQLKDCQVHAETFTPDEEQQSQPILQDCQVEGGEICKTAIKRSTLDCSDAQTCCLEDSLVVNSHVLHSSLVDCGIADSVLHNCETTKGLLKDYVSQTTSEVPAEGFHDGIRAWDKSSQGG